MSNSTESREIPRHLQARVRGTLATFIEDAAVNNTRTPNGLHDVLERNHGLDTIDSRRRLTSGVQQKERECNDLTGQIQTAKDLSDSVQQLMAIATRAKEMTEAQKKSLDRWEHTKTPEMVQHGLKLISEYVNDYPMITPDLIELLKPTEGKCRSDIRDASKTTERLLAELTAVQQRCATINQVLENRDFQDSHGVDERNGISMDALQSELSLTRQKLDEKKQELDNSRGQVKQASAQAQIDRAELANLKSKYDMQTNVLRRVAKNVEDLQKDLNEFKEGKRLALESSKAAKDTLAHERTRFEEIISSRERELDKLRQQHTSVVNDAQGISQAISTERVSNADLSSLPLLMRNALSDVVTHMKSCTQLQKERDRLQERLDVASKDIEQKNQFLNNLSHISTENQDGRNLISEQRKKLAEQEGLIAKLPSLDEYQKLRQSLQEAEAKAQSASHSNDVVTFCSSVLATISAHRDDDCIRLVNVPRLTASWDTAVKWSQQNTSSLGRRRFLAVVHGLVTPVIGNNDVLNLARLLLVRAHTSPSVLSVALVEQLATAMETAGETDVTRVLGFVYTLLQEKGPNPQNVDPWSFPRALLVVRCLSILASYIQGGEICSRLITIAQSVRDKIPPSIMIRVMLEHVVKLLSGAPEFLADTLAQASFAQRVVTGTSHTIYPDGENLIVVDGDKNVAFVRPNQFDWDYGDFVHCLLKFQMAPLLGTRAITLPSLIREIQLYDMFHDALIRSEGSRSLEAYLPDHTFVVE